jgi:hypothetical protein
MIGSNMSVLAATELGSVFSLRGFARFGSGFSIYSRIF